MIRLIDADALRARFQAILDRGDMFCEYDIIGMVDNAPTVKTFTLEDIEEQYRKGLEKGLSEWETERPRGKWIDIDSFVSKARCSKCKNIMLTEPYGKTNFCPNCGADMRGGKRRCG